MSERIDGHMIKANHVSVSYRMSHDKIKSIKEYLVAIALGFCVLPVVELVKLIKRRISR